jgi:hypothetical protein
MTLEVCWDGLWTLVFWALTISWSRLLAHVWSDPSCKLNLNERGEPTTTYIWIGWVWQITGSSSRNNRLNFEASKNVAIVLEESMEYIDPKLVKQKCKITQHVNQMDFGNARILTDYAPNIARTRLHLAFGDALCATALSTLIRNSWA